MESFGQRRGNLEQYCKETAEFDDHVFSVKDFDQVWLGNWPRRQSRMMYDVVG